MKTGVMLVLMLLTGPAFSDDLIRLWGPESFIKSQCNDDYGECEAQVFEVSVATLGVGPPYSINVINGDAAGNLRATSASVKIDGQVLFRPNDFKTNTAALTAPVTLADTSIVRVEIDGAPGSRISLSIEGYAPGHLRIAGPGGGQLKYENSVVLDVPPSAVSNYMAIELYDLPCQDVDEIVNGSRLSAALRGCLGAFSANPDGFAFRYPITATFPVSAIQSPGGYPVLLEIDADNSTFGYRPTDVTYDGEHGQVSAAISHFSGVAVVEASSLKAAVDCLGDKDCLDLVELVEDCSYCDTWSMECGVLGAVQPPCCSLSPAERNVCRAKGRITGDCECCKEKTIHSKSDFSLLSNGSADCELAGEQVKISYLSCPNQPTEDASMKGKSKSCPKDLKVSLTVSPDFAEILTGQSATYGAEIKGTSSEGTRTFPADTVGWFTGDPQVARLASSPIGQQVAVQGVDRGSTTVTAVETGLVLKDNAVISVDELEEAAPVNVAFVVYNGQYDYSRFPPYGWALWAPYATGWFDEFKRYFQNDFDLSLAIYNKAPDRCQDLDWCGFASEACTAHRTLMPLRETGVPVQSEWQSSWDSIETVCDEDPFEAGEVEADRGSSFYSALIDTIRTSHWSPDAKMKVIFAFPYYPTCAFYIGSGDAYTCDAEVGTGLTLGDVASVANEAGVSLFVFNTNTGNLPECGRDNCVGRGGSFCYAVHVAPRDEFIALASSTNGAYYAAYCGNYTIDGAVKQAIFDLYKSVSASQPSP